jgi:hypothetical protein
MPDVEGIGEALLLLMPNLTTSLLSLMVLLKGQLYEESFEFEFELA